MGSAFNKWRSIIDWKICQWFDHASDRCNHATASYSWMSHLRPGWKPKCTQIISQEPTDRLQWLHVCWWWVKVTLFFLELGGMLKKAPITGGSNIQQGCNVFRYVVALSSWLQELPNGLNIEYCIALKACISSSLFIFILISVVFLCYISCIPWSHVAEKKQHFQSAYKCSSAISCPKTLSHGIFGASWPGLVGVHSQRIEAERSERSQFCTEENDDHEENRWPGWPHWAPFDSRRFNARDVVRNTFPFGINDVNSIDFRGKFAVVATQTVMPGCRSLAWLRKFGDFLFFFSKELIHLLVFTWSNCRLIDWLTIVAILECWMPGDTCVRLFFSYAIVLLQYFMKIVWAVPIHSFRNGWTLTHIDITLTNLLSEYIICPGCW